MFQAKIVAVLLLLLIGFSKASGQYSHYLELSMNVPNQV